jgi:hypothetical protein
MTTFDPLLALRILAHHAVRFVVIGGYAAGLRGSPVVTGDLDICHARDEANLERLAEALQELEARLRGPNVSDDLPFILDAKTLAVGDSFTFTTRGGSVDILATPSGTRGFPDLVAAATPMTVDGFEILVASIDDLIRMKEAAARRKDTDNLEWLRAVRKKESSP